MNSLSREMIKAQWKRIDKSDVTRNIVYNENGHDSEYCVRNCRIRKEEQNESDIAS